LFLSGYMSTCGQLFLSGYISTCGQLFLSGYISTCGQLFHYKNLHVGNLIIVYMYFEVKE
jgi:hypothetical protein